MSNLWFQIPLWIVVAVGAILGLTIIYYGTQSFVLIIIL